MKILIYTPYLKILGGGEQSLLHFADCFKHGNQITFVSKEPLYLKRAGARFNINTKAFAVIPSLPSRQALKQFDLLFFVSDGSIPFLPFSKSILFFMNPFPNVAGKTLANRIKLKFINYVICNSKYTKSFIDKEFAVNSHYIYPPVIIKKQKSVKKNLIISVGRFTPNLHVKRQQDLIKAFIDLEPKIPGWELILVGGTESGSQPLLTELRRLAANHRITIKPNLSIALLNRLYSQAKLYWHAAGFKADLTSYPEKAEHFGITIVEAMGHGAVPIVFNAGGPKEIITSKTGRTWNHPAQLKSFTLDFISHPKKLLNYSQAAMKRFQDFSKQKYCHKFHQLIS